MGSGFKNLIATYEAKGKNGSSIRLSVQEIKVSFKNRENPDDAMLTYHMNLFLSIRSMHLLVGHRSVRHHGADPHIV